MNMTELQILSRETVETAREYKELYSKPDKVPADYLKLLGLGNKILAIYDLSYKLAPFSLRTVQKRDQFEAQVAQLEKAIIEAWHGGQR